MSLTFEILLSIGVGHCAKSATAQGDAAETVGRVINPARALASPPNFLFINFIVFYSLIDEIDVSFPLVIASTQNISNASKKIYFCDKIPNAPIRRKNRLFFRQFFARPVVSSFAARSRHCRD